MKACRINSISAEGTEILAKLLDMEVEPEEAIGPAKKKAVAADLCTRREEGKGRERGEGEGGWDGDRAAARGELAAAAPGPG